MKTSMMISRFFSLGLILCLLCLAATACVPPSSIPSTSPSEIVSKVIEATPTHTPSKVWSTYQNTDYHFQLSYPIHAQMKQGANGYIARIDLPITPGTNLLDKYFQIDIQENTAECISPLAQGYEPGALKTDQVILNGIEFQLNTGSEGAAGNYYEWTSYSTTRDGICVSISFILHSTNPFNYPTPPTEFDRASETSVFIEIVSTFKWTN